MAFRIALVGLTGVGKSTIGKALAEEIGADFLDLDKEIEKTAGCRIPTIFAQYGEEAFRTLEKNTLAEVAEGKMQKVVLSTGGGAVLSSDNRSILRDKYTTIWLVASAQTIAGRLGFSGVRERPLLQRGAKVQVRLTELELERREFYQEVADFMINVEDKDVEGITNEIIAMGGWQKCSE